MIKTFVHRTPCWIVKRTRLLPLARSALLFVHCTGDRVLGNAAGGSGGLVGRNRLQSVHCDTCQNREVRLSWSSYRNVLSNHIRSEWTSESLYEVIILSSKNHSDQANLLVQILLPWPQNPLRQISIIYSQLYREMLPQGVLTHGQIGLDLDVLRNTLELAIRSAIIP